MEKLSKKHNELFIQTKNLLSYRYAPSHALKVQGLENTHLVYPKIALPDIFRHSSYDQKFSWAKKVLSVYMQNLSVDAFKNDQLGFTRLYYESKAHEAVSSCIEKSLFAGVSFLWVLKDDSEYRSKFLVRGAHTTAIVKDNNDNIIFAITRVNNEDNINSDYFVYTEDKFYKVNNEGEILERANNEGIDIIVFSVDARYGHENIGNSIFSEEFFTAQKNASIAQNLMQQGSLLTLANKNLLIAEGMEPTVYDNELEDERPALEEKNDASQITTIYNPNASGSLKLETLEEISVESVKELVRENARIAASMVFTSPEIFGYPEEVKGETGFKERIHEIRSQLSHPIEAIARIVLRNYLGLKEEDPSWGDLDVKFYQPIELSKIGQVGDALYKLKELGADVTSITDNLVGKELKPEKMLIPLPNIGSIETRAVINEEENINEIIRREQDFVNRLNNVSIPSSDNNV